MKYLFVFAGMLSVNTLYPCAALQSTTALIKEVTVYKSKIHEN